MNSANESPWKYVILWLRIVFGVHLFYSGIAYVIGGWTPVGVEQQLSSGLRFINELNTVGMFPYIKYLELIVGIMLICNIATPLALVLEFPITATIASLNLLVEGYGRHLFTGTQELFLNASLLLAYGGYYVSFLSLRSKPAWLWNGSVVNKLAASDDDTATPGKGITQALIITISLSIAVLLASKLLGSPERQLPPRDYVPLICGFIMFAFTYFNDRKSKNV